MLTKEPEMLQQHAFCEHTKQQNATTAGALPWTMLIGLTVLPCIPKLVLRQPLHSGEEKGKGREGERKGRIEAGREGWEGEGRLTDAQPPIG